MEGSARRKRPQGEAAGPAAAPTGEKRPLVEPCEECAVRAATAELRAVAGLHPGQRIFVRWIVETAEEDVGSDASDAAIDGEVCAEGSQTAAAQSAAKPAAAEPAASEPAAAAAESVTAQPAAPRQAAPAEAVAAAAASPRANASAASAAPAVSAAAVSPAKSPFERVTQSTVVWWPGGISDAPVRAAAACRRWRLHDNALNELCEEECAAYFAEGEPGAGAGAAGAVAGAAGGGAGGAFGGAGGSGAFCTGAGSAAAGAGSAAADVSPAGADSSLRLFTSLVRLTRASSKARLAKALSADAAACDRCRGRQSSSAVPIDGAVPCAVIPSPFAQAPAPKPAPPRRRLPWPPVFETVQGVVVRGTPAAADRLPAPTAEANLASSDLTGGGPGGAAAGGAGGTGAGSPLSFLHLWNVHYEKFGDFQAETCPVVFLNRDTVAHMSYDAGETPLQFATSEAEAARIDAELHGAQAAGDGDEGEETDIVLTMKDIFEEQQRLDREQADGTFNSAEDFLVSRLRTLPYAQQAEFAARGRRFIDDCDALLKQLIAEKGLTHVVSWEDIQRYFADARRTHKK